MGWFDRLIGGGSTSAGNFLFHETSLGTLLPGTLLGSVVASPDARRVAYVVRTGARWFMVIDGRPNPKEYDLPIPFDLPMPFADFSPEKQEKILSVLNHESEVQNGFLDNVFGRAVFSPDSRRLAYVGYRSATQEIFRHLPPFRVPVKHFLVLDGEEGEEFDRIVHRSVAFSPDSKRLAYAAERHGKFRVVVDGHEGRQFDDNYNPVFSADSQHVGYVGGRVGSRSAVVDDEIISGKYPDVGGGTGVVFSPDGQRLAFAAVAAPDKEFMVIDGKEDPPYTNVGKLHFSPDSRRVLYTAWRGKQAFAVLDGVPGQAYDMVGYPAQPFSADSRRVIYLAASGGRKMVVVDGQEEGTYDEIPWLWFSPNSRRVAYRARRGGKEFAVVDGQEGKHYDMTFAPTFSPDSARVAHFVERSGRTFLVVDGVEDRAKEYRFCVCQLVFDGPNRLHTLAARTGPSGTELFRVDVETPEKT